MTDGSGLISLNVFHCFSSLIQFSSVRSYLRMIIVKVRADVMKEGKYAIHIIIAYITSQRSVLL